MPEKPENRVERIVSDLLRGRRLRLRAGDAEEKEAITAAARFAAALAGRSQPRWRSLGHDSAQPVGRSRSPSPA